MSEKKLIFPISLDQGDFEAAIILDDEYYERIIDFIYKNHVAIEEGYAEDMPDVEGFSDVFEYLEIKVAEQLANSIHDDSGAYEDSLEEDEIDIENEDELIKWVQENISFAINWPMIDDAEIPLFYRYVGRPVSAEKIEEGFSVGEEVEWDGYGDPSDGEMEGMLIVTLRSSKEEIDGCEGELFVQLAIDIDEEGEITEVTPLANFYCHGEDGEPELDADDYWEEDDYSMASVILEELTE